MIDPDLLATDHRTTARRRGATGPPPPAGPSPAGTAPATAPAETAPVAPATRATPATAAANDAPARDGLARRARHQARYAWHNSGDGALVTARRCWDGRSRRRVATVVSTAPGGPSLGYAGIPEGVLNVLAFLEQQRERGGGGPAERSAGTASWPDLVAGRALRDTDLVAVGCSAAQAAALPRAAALVVPFRVHLVVEVDGDADTMRQRISKRERWQFSRNRKVNEWAFEQDDDPAAFEWFYDRMHRPTMQERHGERMRTEDAAVAYECLFRRGMLFFVAERGRRIAGVLCRWDPATGTLTTRLLGVLDGADEHYASGAFKAVYHFLLEWACDHGVRRIDFHGTEAFLSKGIFAWKRKFRPAVVLPPNHFADKRLWLAANRDTPAVRDFLVANPTVAMTPDGGLDAVYFYDADRPARTDLACDCPGVQGTRHVDLDGFLTPARWRRKEIA